MSVLGELFEKGIKLVTRATVKRAGREVIEEAVEEGTEAAAKATASRGLRLGANKVVREGTEAVGESAVEEGVSEAAQEITEGTVGGLGSRGKDLLKRGVEVTGDAAKGAVKYVKRASDEVFEASFRSAKELVEKGAPMKEIVAAVNKGGIQKTADLGKMAGKLFKGDVDKLTEFAAEAKVGRGALEKFNKFRELGIFARESGLENVVKTNAKGEIIEDKLVDFARNIKLGTNPEDIASFSKGFRMNTVPRGLTVFKSGSNTSDFALRLSPGNNTLADRAADLSITRRAKAVIGTGKFALKHPIAAGTIALGTVGAGYIYFNLDDDQELAPGITVEDGKIKIKGNDGRETTIGAEDLKDGSVRDQLADLIEDRKQADKPWYANIGETLKDSLTGKEMPWLLGALGLGGMGAGKLGLLGNGFMGEVLGFIFKAVATVALIGVAVWGVKKAYDYFSKPKAQEPGQGRGNEIQAPGQERSPELAAVGEEVEKKRAAALAARVGDVMDRRVTGGTTETRVGKQELVGVGANKGRENGGFTPDVS